MPAVRDNGMRSSALFFDDARTCLKYRVTISEENFFMLSHHAGSARRWDARPSRLHLRHQELQVQGGRDQEDQQGKDHFIVFFKTSF